MLFCLLLMLHPGTTPAEPQPALQILHYRGELLRRDADGFSPIDDFELILLVDAAGATKGSAVLQSGIDREPWAECLGEPGIKHVHDGVPYRLQPVALSVKRKLTEGSVWVEDRKTFRVGGLSNADEKEAREIFVSEGTARNHRLLVDPTTGQLISLTQRVFMGRGDEFRLTLKQLPANEKSSAGDTKFFATLQEIKQAVGETETSGLTEKQLSLVSTALPELQKTATSRWAKQFVSQIASETGQSQRRTKKLADLKTALTGKPLPEFSGRTLDGKDFDSSSLRGKVVVLHVWQYRNEPLTEPYGQTAYLDFLSDQFASKPVAVVGLNLDTRYADATQVNKANRSARKLIEFMNITFPVVANDGSIMKKLGDPRAAGAKLPLWIVADKSGKVQLWKSGYFDVDARVGLRDLRKAIEQALK